MYAKTLEELRKKEESIRRDIADGLDYAAGEIPVIELVKRYMSLKRDLSINTQRAYGTVINRIEESDFGQFKVNKVKLSDAKKFYIDLHDKGIRRNTITIYHSVLRPAFEMAVDDDIIRKNPFKFQIADIIQNDAVERVALEKEQRERYLKFVLEQGGKNYYNDIVVLLETGLRVSELYGLTRADVDFDKRCIHVKRQLCRTGESPYFVTTPKTKSGVRCIPMTDTAYSTMMRVVQERKTPKVEMMVGGCTGFLFLDKEGKPKVAMHLENFMRGIQRKYTKLHGNTLPHITPHVLRHTFCTNMQRAGLDAKSLQYLMGHSNVSVTLDVYTHSSYETVKESFAKAAANL